ncbi:hypothetical protein JOF55_004193 [Haloactinomyces albus]|uniref:Uncharacterized protein n=1 Tax=Haloactinomyces albus TaxID=1352928 RepID=A0AAE3ZIV2_9ACTN|nr:hypothetical protein [Haloactinomyces albus]
MRHIGRVPGGGKGVPPLGGKHPGERARRSSRCGGGEVGGRYPGQAVESACPGRQGRGRETCDTGATQLVADTAKVGLVHTGHGEWVQGLQEQGTQTADPHHRGIAVNVPGHRAGTEQAHIRAGRLLLGSLCRCDHRTVRELCNSAYRAVALRRSFGPLGVSRAGFRTGGVRCPPGWAGVVSSGRPSADFHGRAPPAAPHPVTPARTRETSRPPSAVSAPLGGVSVREASDSRHVE